MRRSAGVSEVIKNTMPPDLANDVTASYLSQGVLGTTVVVLIFVILKLWAKLERVQEIHKIELAAKDGLIKDLYDQRLSEARIGFDIAKTTQSSLDAFLAAVRGGKGHL